MKTLLVGFRQYAGHDTNPSERILPHFEGKEDVETLLLDASYAKTKTCLCKAIEEKKPSFVLIANLSPFHHSPVLEQYAYNEMNATCEDAEGCLKSGETILPDGPKSLACPFDLSRFSQFLMAEEIENSISVDGGRFFCNEAYYLALSSGIPSLLIHLPLESDCPLEEDEKLVEGILSVASKNI